MKRIALLLLVTLALLLLAACGGEEAEPTAAPTSPPPTEAPPTELPPPATAEATAPAQTTEEGSYVDTLAHVPDPKLVNIPWEWVRRDPNGNDIAEITVPNPENYTLTFNEDGTFLARLDCNTGSGRYATDQPGSIFMELGATTFMACPEGSLDADMQLMFGPAQNYRFEDDDATLAFSWVAGGPVDYYRNPAVAAPAAEDENTLTGVTWQWQSITDPNGETTVDEPGRYTVFFSEDGTANIKADCNQVVASYTTDGSSITVTLGPSTLVACPEGSRDQQFLFGLENAAIYFFLEDELYIDMFADAGTMRFAAENTVDLPEPESGDPTGTVTAPDGVFLRTGPGTQYPAVGAAPLGETGTIIGVSADAQWWVIETPDLNNGQVWVSANFVDATGAENVPVVAAPPLPAPDGLTGVTWQWVSTTTAVEQITVSDPTRYTILFNADGTAAIQADCNQVTATYTTSGSSISITLGAATLAACPEGSQDQLFTTSLANAAIYFFLEGDLYMDLFADSGTMRFSTGAVSGGGDTTGGDTTGGDQPLDTDSPTGGAEGTTLVLTSFGPAGAEQAVIPGTTITAAFSEGQVSGSAGCNSYSAPIIPGDGFFTIGLPAVTFSVCTEPEGIMDQETAYLAALVGVNGYEWTSEIVNGVERIVSGRLLYTLADGTSGVMNFVAQ